MNTFLYPGMKEFELIKWFMDELAKKGYATKIDADTFDVNPVAVVFEPGWRICLK